MKQTDDDDTFMDKMIQYLLKNKVGNKHIDDLTAWMVEEAFDSDTLKYDIADVGNILNHIENQDLADSIKNVFAAFKSMIFFI